MHNDRQMRDFLSTTCAERGVRPRCGTLPRHNVTEAASGEMLWRKAKAAVPPHAVPPHAPPSRTHLRPAHNHFL